MLHSRFIFLFQLLKCLFGVNGAPLKCHKVDYVLFSPPPPSRPPSRHVKSVGEGGEREKRLVLLSCNCNETLAALERMAVIKKSCFLYYLIILASNIFIYNFDFPTDNYIPFYVVTSTYKSIICAVVNSCEQSKMTYFYGQNTKWLHQKPMKTFNRNQS